MLEEKNGFEKLGVFFHTPRYMFYFTIVWGLFFSIISPLFSQLAPIYGNDSNDFQRIMYLHMLTVTLVVALTYIIVDIYKDYYDLSTSYGRIEYNAIMYGGIIAMLFSTFAIIDTVPDSIETWLIIFGFLFLDEIALSLLITLPLNAYKRQGLENTDLSFWLLWVSLLSALIAAIMGHIAGFVISFGGSFMTGYINSIGETVATFESNSMGSHSHDMIVAIMAGIVALFATKYGYNAMKGFKKFIVKVGLEITIFGVLAMTAVYVLSGIGNYVIPAMFSSGPGLYNGLAQDDMLTGIVGLGAFIVLIGMLWAPTPTFRKFSNGIKYLMYDPIGMAILLSWVFALVTIPVIGYFIEFHETYFGILGTLANAPGAISDANYMRWHQMFGFFLMPAMSTLLIGFDYFNLLPENRKLTSYSLIFGALMMFIGGVGTTFFDTSQWNFYWYVAIIGMVFFVIGVLVALYTGYITINKNSFDKGADIKPSDNNPKKSGEVLWIGIFVVIVLIIVALLTMGYVNSMASQYSFLDGVPLAGNVGSNLSVNMTFPYTYQTGSVITIPLVSNANFTLKNITTNNTSFSIVSYSPSGGSSIVVNETINVMIQTPSSYTDTSLYLFVNSF